MANYGYLKDKQGEKLFIDADSVYGVSRLFVQDVTVTTDFAGNMQIPAFDHVFPICAYDVTMLHGGTNKNVAVQFYYYGGHFFVRAWSVDPIFSVLKDTTITVRILYTTYDYMQEKAP